MSTKGDMGNLPDELFDKGNRLYDDCSDRTFNIEMNIDDNPALVEIGNGEIDRILLLSIKTDSEFFKALCRATAEYKV